jgi:hypothetical protein
VGVPAGRHSLRWYSAISIVRVSASERPVRAGTCGPDQRGSCMFKSPTRIIGSWGVSGEDNMEGGFLGVEEEGEERKLERNKTEVSKLGGLYTLKRDMGFWYEVEVIDIAEMSLHGMWIWEYELATISA